MQPKIWGPPMWFTLHSISFFYPDKPTATVKRRYYDFFHNLQYVIPCLICQKHYSEHLKKYPITPYLDSKKSLIKWLIFIHNSVNKLEKKPIMQPKDVINRYSKIYSQSNEFQCGHIKDIPIKKQKVITCQKTYMYNYILISVLLILIIIYIIKYIYFK